MTNTQGSDYQNKRFTVVLLLSMRDEGVGLRMCPTIEYSNILFIGGKSNTIFLFCTIQT